MKSLQKPGELVDVIDNLREGVQVIGVDWRYLHLNRAALEHARQPREALIGKTMMECYPGIETTEMFRMLDRVMRGGGPASMTNEFTYPDGRIGWFELRAQTVPLGLVILSIDVTKTREIEQSLRQAMKLEALGRLAGSVAHDFNNIITVIGGCTAILADSVTDERIAKDLNQINDAIGRASRLTGQLAAFARNRPAAPVAVDPWGVTSGLLAMATLMLGSAVEVERRRGERVSNVLIDPGALEQVMLNLFLNARDAMLGQGRLTVEATELDVKPDSAGYDGLALPCGRFVVLAVTDTGCGIPSENRDRIFDPFFSTKGDAGAGLGLANSYRLVALAGGTITVDSRPGQGATFRVYLPVAPVRLNQAGPMRVEERARTPEVDAPTAERLGFRRGSLMELYQTPEPMARRRP